MAKSRRIIYFSQHHNRKGTNLRFLLEKGKKPSSWPPHHAQYKNQLSSMLSFCLCNKIRYAKCSRLSG